MGVIKRLVRRGQAADMNSDADAQASSQEPISHALVLPDQYFLDWYAAAEPYTQAFPRVAVVRSPAGNDLNRYRNITAVEAPNVWMNDDALAHIRRVYRSVVRVDTIRATTPNQLEKILIQRIDRDDRYGETQNADDHLDDGFILSWPADALPARITLPFNADGGDGSPNEGLDLVAPPGTTIRAPLSGTVAVVARVPTDLGYGAYIQISTIHHGVHYLVTLAYLARITVQAGQSVRSGDPVAVANGDGIRLVVQSPGRGLSGYILPHVIDPTDLIYWNTLRVRPTGNGLRVRRRPGTKFEIVTEVSVSDDLETLETHGRTLAKVGQKGQWLNVRTPNGRTGYSAAWLLQAIAPELIDQARLTGVNLDAMHPLGRPAPSRLGGIGWVRLNYNVSFNPANRTYGNTDLIQAYSRYRPLIEQYARAGCRVMIVFTHQTYGEGAGFNWNQMDGGQWLALTARFVEMIREIARSYAGQNLVQAYQIWNEQDALPGLVSAVSMLPGDYAFLLGESIRAIRSVDPRVTILTGGHNSGPGRGVEYARAVLRSLPPGAQVDGIAFHPYGRGTDPGSPYAPFGLIDEEIDGYHALLPGRPVWITEWGVLDHPTDPPQSVANYAAEMVRWVRLRYPGQVAAMIWFAWAQGMHNAYGLIGADDRPIQPLYNEFLRL
ncbi:MAG: peptidoglycan DD-metalloendopeptidase family protein [Anaerolineae bacterium]|nr:peptidoglycan DD-metalloendopeptidase family protein [Anaerolineae bacterium]